MAIFQRWQPPQWLIPILEWTFRLGVLLLPAALLLVESLRHHGSSSVMLWMGTAFQLVVCFLALLNRRTLQASMGPSVIVLYAIALGWLWLGAVTYDSWTAYMAQAIFLVVPLVVFAYQTLVESGAPALRRARLLADRLSRRGEWPADLAEVRTLPEVKAFREALHIDATPALALLRHRQPEVRIAALGALEFRKNWKPGQAELVLQVGRRAEEPVIRAAAIMALANLDSPPIVEGLGEFLRDHSPLVRRAAAESLLWDTEVRWPHIRHAFHRYLRSPLFQDDGPLPLSGRPLTDEAVKDISGWTAEKGAVGLRAALTLGVHYNRVFSDQPDRKLADQLRQQLASPHTPPTLRLELANVLQQHGELTRSLHQLLLGSANPAPLRLIAAEHLLAAGQRDEVMPTLLDLAHLPNREIALSTADVIQRRLGVDFGLAVGQDLPPVHSRLAADIARRVHHWARQQQSRTPEPSMVAARERPAGGESSDWR